MKRVLLTPKEKEERRNAKREEREAAKIAARIQALKDQPPVKDIRISIEWKRSREWGLNPYIEAYSNIGERGYRKVTGKCSGCGYDKESEVMAMVFNQLLAYRLFQLDLSAAPYGISKGVTAPYYVGAIGMECYYEIARFIGGTLVKIASGKTFDAYQFTMGETK